MASRNTKLTTKKGGNSSRVGKAGWKQRFLESMARIPNVTVACRKAHISRVVAYKTKNEDKAFAEAWETAALEGVEGLEQEMWRRATKGTRKGVWMKDAKGKPTKVEDITTYSDTLAIFLAKGHLPQKYHDNVHTEISGPAGAPLPLHVICLRPDELPQPAKPPGDKT